jgi:hypothetical protein
VCFVDASVYGVNLRMLPSVMTCAENNVEDVYLSKRFRYVSMRIQDRSAVHHKKLRIIRSLDGIVAPAARALITGAYGTNPESQHWYSNADLAEPYGQIDILDIVACTSHYGDKLQGGTSESLFISKQHVWYNVSGDWSEAAFLVINTGGRDTVLDKIALRGEDCPWTNVYYWTAYNVTIWNDLEATQARLGGAAFNITIQDVARTLKQATSSILLKSGWVTVFYIGNPDHITLYDVGLAVGISVFTATTQYYKEANVNIA